MHIRPFDHHTQQNHTNINITEDYTPHKLRGRGWAVVFLGMAGISAGAFAAGFDDCFFTEHTAQACMNSAKDMIPMFQAVGDHIIGWISALIRSA